MLRECVDDVLQTAKTGRRAYSQLEKTEKTYIGTRVEIMLRALLDLEKGKLDTVIKGRDVDIKNTMGSNWMIPTEAIDHPCMLVAADEESSLCYFGIFIAREEYLTRSSNRDAKKSISQDGFSNIYWIFREEEYPPNFWRTVSEEAVAAIFNGKNGNERVKTLFRYIQERVITRDIIEAVAQQSDFMRRLRSDKKRGTRQRLAEEGIILLNGHFDSGLISLLNLPYCGKSEFISFKPKSIEEWELINKFKPEK
nr:NaeI family type II restriction endonuclease [Sneathiella chungangensis]